MLRMELYNEFKNLISALDTHKVPYALCGGLAMAVYDIPRATIDIDLLVEETYLKILKDITAKLGFKVEAGLMVFKKGKIKIHRLVKIDQELGDELILDLILVTPDIRDVWDKRETVVMDWGNLIVVSRNGLIKMKSLRNSGRDQDDIKKLKGEKDEV